MSAVAASRPLRVLHWWDVAPLRAEEDAPAEDTAGPPARYRNRCVRSRLAHVWGDPPGSYAHRGEPAQGEPVSWFVLASRPPLRLPSGHPAAAHSMKSSRPSLK